MRNSLIIILSVLLVTSCVKKAENPNAGANRSAGTSQVQAGNQNTPSANNGAASNRNSGGAASMSNASSRGSDYNINTKANYFKEMRNALGINNKKMKKMMEITEKYQPQIKANKSNPNKLTNLREAKNREIGNVLTPEQMEQKKYIDAVFYGYSGQSPAHPVNLKRAMGISDGKMLDYLVIQGTYNAAKKRFKSNGQLSDAKLGELLATRNENLSQVFNDSEFAKFRQVMKQAYGNK